jgi:transposase InsO family protein
MTNLRAWDELGVDLIGPWKLQINGYKYSLRALTCTDSVINLSEIIPINDATAQTVATAFENEWLNRYPQLLRCIHDNGSGFIVTDFQEMLKHNGLSSAPTTVKNPQGNSITEQLHQTISTMIAMAIQENPPSNPDEAINLIMNKRAAAYFAMIASTHRI